MVPQIVYYVYAYAKLFENGEIEKDEQINVTVPTGNFGNILAAYFAKRMGLPIKTLICASTVSYTHLKLDAAFCTNFHAVLNCYSHIKKTRRFHPGGP